MWKTEKPTNKDKNPIRTIEVKHATLSGNVTKGRTSTLMKMIKNKSDPIREETDSDSSLFERTLS